MDCNDNFLGLATHMQAMARVSGALIGMPIVSVTGHTSQALQCDDGLPRTFEKLLAASIGVDSCGKPAFRVKFIDSCNTKVDCSNNTNMNFLDQMFAYDATAKTFALVINQSS